MITQSRHRAVYEVWLRHSLHRYIPESELRGPRQAHHIVLWFILTGRARVQP